MPVTADARVDNTEEFKLPSEKEFAIFKVANTALYRIGFKDGGELPKELKNQMFTTHVLAAKAIKDYLRRKAAEEESKKGSKNSKGKE